MSIILLSIVSFFCSLVILLFGINNSSDPLFFVVSGALAICLVRLFVCGIFVAISYVELPNSQALKNFLAMAGTTAIVFSAAGFFTNSFNFSLYGIMKPLDYLLMAEIGIMMSILAFEIETESSYASRLTPLIRQSLAVPVRLLANPPVIGELLPTHDRAMMISAFSLHMRKMNSG
jgi:hypothetical protein